MSRRILAMAATVALAASCQALGLRPQPQPQLSPQERFWSSLQALCGGTFRGELGDGHDAAFAEGPVVAAFDGCRGDEVAITVQVGEDHSRRWVISRTSTGLQLTHHHEQGEPLTLSGYGGNTVRPGSAGRQEFVADAETRKLLPAAADNLWTVEIVPGRTFTYSVHRQGTERRLRLAFDLTAASAARPDPGDGPRPR